MPDSAHIVAPASAGVPGFPGPFPVGRYSLKLRERLREFAHVCLIGEATGVRIGSGPQVWFELRDGDGAIPCAMWRDDFDRLGLGPDDLRDGAEVVVAGGCEWYPGSASASPRLSFRVRELRLAGEGDLLARLARLRRQLASEGLFEHQKRLARPRLPRRIGVVTAESGAARRDFLAGLERRRWRGALVWGYAPVQGKHAAKAITDAIRDLAAYAQVDTIVVTRGGGSIADLWAFCDETLCRTVALTPVPVISAVGHEVDRTLIDDVAACCCSTPT
ncbi:MAG: exodeoxyribonuclease large subunit, partial [Thermoleophilaceae bacterium]|nr:exodeoxyribonuclease large subunit [Thermoleophilaceae bacterium]